MLNDSRVDKILDGLETINSSKDLKRIKNINAVRNDAPKRSIQKNELYLSWKDSPYSEILWICGSPGKGKLLAAISMVDELSQLQEDDREREDGTVLAYFFCDAQEKEKRQVLNVLKTLAWQLLKSKRHLSHYFFREEDKVKSSSTQNNPKDRSSKVPNQRAKPTDADYEFDSLDELWKCFKAALSDPSLGTVYFVVNGLDQIDTASRKEFLGFVTSFRPPLRSDNDDNESCLKWLFLSVSRNDILETMKGASIINVQILNLDDGSNSSGQDADLRAYVSQKVGDLAKERKYSKSLEYFVKSYISSKEAGSSNYDWVNLVCLELDDDKLQGIMVRQRLENLPLELDSMYDQVSKRVSLFTAKFLMSCKSRNNY